MWPFPSSTPNFVSSVNEENQGGGFPASAFVTTWDTTRSGTSNPDQITLPLNSSGIYNFTVQWGDGTSDTITSHLDPEVTHTYPSSGTYQVVIQGILDKWYFNNGGDKLKVMSVDQWGDLVYSEYFRSWSGCENVVFPEIGAPVVTGLTDFTLCFNLCRTTPRLPATMDFSSATSISSCFQRCELVEVFPNSYDLSNVVNFSTAFNRMETITEFPSLDLGLGQDFTSAWLNCNALTTISVTDMSSATILESAFEGCSSLTSLPFLFLSNVTNWIRTFRGCNLLSTIPAYNTSSGTDFTEIFTFTGSIISAALLGTVNDINYGANPITQAGLVDIFDGLGTVGAAGSNTKSIDVSGCAGFASLTPTEIAIAQFKGWNVVGAVAPEPSDISALNLWWDFTDTSTTTVTAGIIDSITDKSLNGNDGTGGGLGGNNVLEAVDVNGITYADFQVSADNWMSLVSQLSVAGAFTFVVFTQGRNPSGFDVIVGGDSILSNRWRAAYGSFMASNNASTIATFAFGFAGTMVLLRDGGDVVQAYDGSTLLPPSAGNSSNFGLRGLGRINSTNNANTVGLTYGFCYYAKELSIHELQLLDVYAASVLQFP